MYTFEGIFRGRSDSILFAIVVDQAARYLAIRHWAAAPNADAPRTVVEMQYGDHTEFPSVLDVARQIARHLSRDRVQEAAQVLKESGYSAEPLDETQPGSNQ